MDPRECREPVLRVAASCGGRRRCSGKSRAARALAAPLPFARSRANCRGTMLAVGRGPRTPLAALVLLLAACRLAWGADLLMLSQ